MAPSRLSPLCSDPAMRGCQHHHARRGLLSVPPVDFDESAMRVHIAPAFGRSQYAVRTRR
jgi:hypothetical protein